MLIKETHTTIVYYCDLCKSKIKHLIEYAKPHRCTLCNKELCEHCISYLFNTLICIACRDSLQKDFKKLINKNKANNYDQIN